MSVSVIRNRIRDFCNRIFLFLLSLGERLCIHPLLDNTSRLVKISHYKGKDVLFVGDPHILHFSSTFVHSFACLF